ncbi:undecaprenyldiphospho-muramoylpentapeptide beta-N-acetylglucosaminyltransferase [Aminicella lysinilytica]|uniref:UDP-N-acetylglucosamine--N-acetylmuramyl-(pentapeptide) pyrophosphoryl-undecaprenol N-acetylglucosamine transferase n=1 Tax=Aminicella lysinilytica TaxID=433323 RepID=A0A4R6QEC9_9FIRM|nr:undecaprenyldiphospho-muramoylpentapeptide beta-N-acetylglucosaminyltransferase [Aminicella lysinilytica]NLD10676.1 undecaprenyldiphospho-muramoylpentapeptide beta-N-acetylglucosaminyltransferase [Clostridiales bacterium]TDP59799.1 UDP-N-acetylglucosamine-N-acetylmuramylpentapeptide N-acetylglucosamine transferase [Aminicella lysinilytica]
MKVIVTGGGTGGHIYPALAIADEIKERDPSSEILYVGNDIGLEKDIVPGSGYDMELVSAKWLDRSNIFKIFDTGFSTMKGIRQSMKIMKNFKPDVVIGTGGFVCVPVIYAGHKYGARCYLHEQNAFPGVANRTLEKFVNKVFLGFPEASHYFKEPQKHLVTGNPVRSRFLGVDKSEARQKLALDEDDFVIFSFGGSQGAEKINQVVFQLMKTVNGMDHVTLLFGTGSQYYQEILDDVKAQNIELGANIRIESYINDMEDYLGASDLIISRAGALSVAETCMCGRASILIPSPNVTGNHQYFNAKSVADRGGAVLIEEKDLTDELLLEEVTKLKNDPEFVKKMGDAAFACAPKDATNMIYQTICKDEING